MTGNIFLETGELSIGENDGTVFVPIVRTGDLSGSVTIQYGTTGDTASAGSDFSTNNGTITMAAGQDRILVPVQINDDNESEATETFTFSIINIDSGFLQAPRTTRVDILDDENPVTDPPTPPLQSDFEVDQDTVITGLAEPIAMEFSPQDSSVIYIAEKGGKIRVFDTDTNSFKSDFIDLTAQVNNDADRGLMDIAIHPNFPDEPYIYAFYVVDPPETAGRTGSDGPDGSGNRYAHVVKFTADAANNFETVVPGSAEILIGAAGQSLSDISGNGAIDSTSNLNIRASDIDANGDFVQDYIKLDSRSHAGGALEFGPDGALYISTGDGTSFNATDPRTVSVQDVNSLSGKVLRVDPLNGDGLADNPFVQAGDSLDINSSKVYQLGLRNPFSMSFDQDGKLIITDTGWTTWEEINVGGPGANFGWPFYEGGDNGQLLRTGGYRDLPEAQDFYTQVESGAIEVTAAYRAFAHANAEPGFQVQAIVGADDIITSPVYPEALQNNYIFVDFSQGEVFAVDSNDRRDVKFLYKTDNGFGPVHFKQGPDGSLYAVDIVTGSVNRLNITDSNSPANRAPVATNDTGTTQAGEAVTLNVLANDRDADNDTLSISSVSDPANGTAVIDDNGTPNNVSDDSVLYTPDAGFSGTDNFTYQVSDGTDTNTATVSVDVQATTPNPDPNPGETVVKDDPTVTQHLTGSAEKDVFVIDGSSSDYGWDLAQDGVGHVVWNGDAFDVLHGFEKIRFTDLQVNLADLSTEPNPDPNPNPDPDPDPDPNPDPDPDPDPDPNPDPDPDPDPNPGGNVVNDDPTVTQHLTGSAEKDVFVIDGSSADYGWDLAQDGVGHVVWKGSSFDVLHGFEELRFNDQTIDLKLVGTGAGTQQEDDGLIG